MTQEIQLTEKNRIWLNKRFSGAQGNYVTHQPIWGYRRGNTEGGHAIRLCRTLNLLRIIVALKDCESFLDVGCGEGYIGSLVRGLISHSSMLVTDLSLSAVCRANELFGLRSCTSNSAELPFRQDSFDVVICSETLEHVVRPFRTIRELTRVARKFVIITSEASAYWTWHRSVCLKTRIQSNPHYDRNVWHAKDFYMMFGDQCRVYPQFHRDIRNSYEPESIQQAKVMIQAMSDFYNISIKTGGLIVVIAKDGHDLPYHSHHMDGKILDVIFEGPANSMAKRVDYWDEEWLSNVICPNCRNGSVGILNSGDVICKYCLREFGKNDSAIDFLPPVIIENKGLEDELSAIRDLGVDLVKNRYLAGLAYAFSERRIENNLFFYWFYRLIRRFFGLIINLS